MTLAERIALAKAGYTRKEIKAFENEEHEQPEETETGNATTDPVEVIADSGNADPAEETETPESDMPNLDVLPKILERLTALEENRRAENRNSAQMPNQPMDNPVEAITKFLERSN